jgi:hypothetical protein
MHNNGQEFEITVIVLQGKPINIRVRPTDTIYTLRKKLYSQLNILPDHQGILLYGRRILD